MHVRDRKSHTVIPRVRRTRRHDSSCVQHVCRNLRSHHRLLTPLCTEATVVLRVLLPTSLILPIGSVFGGLEASKSAGRMACDLRHITSDLRSQVTLRRPFRPTQNDCATRQNAEEE
jgi:hypothetical protein